MNIESCFCTGCGKDKPLTSQYFDEVHQNIFRNICRQCLTNRHQQADKIRTDRPRAILEDSRCSDRKRNLTNDLGYDFIAEMISRPCAYCGAVDQIMTLDRIDNTKGHTMSNVIPACYRCNLIRRDMPYEAWQYLVPGLRAAYEAGTLGDWQTIPTSLRGKVKRASAE